MKQIKTLITTDGQSVCARLFDYGKRSLYAGMFLRDGVEWVISCGMGNSTQIEEKF